MVSGRRASASKAQAAHRPGTQDAAQDIISKDTHLDSHQHEGSPDDATSKPAVVASLSADEQMALKVLQQRSSPGAEQKIQEELYSYRSTPKSADMSLAPLQVTIHNHNNRLLI